MSFDWEYALSLFGYAPLWRATLVVIVLSLLSWTIAASLGFLLALAKLSSYPILKLPVAAYIWFFRSLPLLVLLIFVYNLPQVLPWTSPYLSSPFFAGLLGLVLSETAYMAEIHRGGLLAVPNGQREAGKALGISYSGIQQLIVIPQAIRVALPTLSNQFITIVKLTSLVSVISLAEILLVGQRLYTQNFKVLETMLMVALFYVLIVTVFDNLLKLGERKMDVTRRKGSAGQAELRAFRESRSTPDAPKPGQLSEPRRTIDENAVVVAASDINKSFDEVQVLKNVSLTVSRGETVSIIGPSGSGKTTFIRTLNGLEIPDSGHITLNGEVSFHRSPNQQSDKGQLPRADQIKNIGMVFQQFNLFPHKTVLQNVTLGPQYHGFGSAKQLELEALAVLDKVGMADHAYKYPHQLSGGQQQRVAIARALAMKPSIMLFDEPTSALDPELVGEVLRNIEDLAREGMTMIIVTHEMAFSRRISDRVVFMEEGAIVHSGSPVEIFEHCDEPRVTRFLKDFKIN
ncbi:amino acid ABC transporter permease/ATP-binding protein [Billgrantia pellis]|uniref:Amino acid ABC transporter permease/ATP-binding protein n=1 Tax=Billgrantia pellis TaxID=2606936 RepID=A0A7V7KFG7_9GAMM|nr:amino acid ABC transporter permease/ATP-binding protein [Halomonas pellis]KAA0010250.1 amino acid ABC transporter permease/ATP-binding protein [Halomonas pellis]